MTSGQAVHARLGSSVDQVVDLVADHGFRPQSIVASAGVPIRLVIQRRDDDPCMDRIVISSPHLDRRLARGAVTTVVLPGQPAGEIRFTCGMGRYHGQIELRPQARSSIAALRSTVGDVLRRGWRVIRGPIEPTVAREAREIVRAGFARARSAKASPPELARGRASPSWETPS